jgi:hypothetical protein
MGTPFPFCRHRHARQDGLNDLVSRLVIQPICESLEAPKEVPPELHPVAEAWMYRERPETNDMLVTDFAALAAGFDQARLQPASGLAETDEHRSGTG